MTTLITGFLALGTSPDPTVFVEQTGSGYARVAMSIEAISHNRSTNVGSATFTADAGDWGNVTQYAICTQITGGVVRFWWNRSRDSVPNGASLVVHNRSFSLLYNDAFYSVGGSTYATGDVIGRDAANNAITAGSAFAVTSGVLSDVTTLGEPATVVCVTQGTTTPYAFLASTPVSISVGGQSYGGPGIYAMDIGIDSDAAITHIAFPGLVGAIWGCSMQSCDNLVAVDLSEMAIAYNGINLSLAGLTTLNLSSLAVVADTTFTLDFVVVSAAITTLTLPSIAFLSRSITFNTPALTSFSFGPNLQYVGSSVLFPNAALNQVSVDGILASLVALTTPFTGTVNLSGGTSATPSVAGAANAAILTGQGATVTTN